jgi:hypothetical protein
MANNIHWRKDISSKLVLGKLPATCRRLELDPYLSACTKHNSKWVEDLNVRSEPSKLPQEKIWKTLEVIVIGHTFLNRTPLAQEIRVRIDKWDYIKLKPSPYQRKQLLESEDNLQKWEKNLCQLFIG